MDSTTETEPPKTWRFDKDGPVADGRYVRLGEGPTKGYGYKPLIVLNIDGVDRTVWLFHTASMGDVFEELQRRPGNELTVGERVVVENRGDAVSESSGRTYKDLKVRFPEKPEPSGRDLLTRYGEQVDIRPQEPTPEPIPRDESIDGDVPF